jgi:hypothetical protein
MEGRMLLAIRARAALLAVAVIVPKSAIAAESALTKAECIAASESGQDLRRTGKLRDARTEFAVCLDPSCPGPIREDCVQHLDEIAKAMPSVVFEVTDSTGNDMPGVAITMDGQTMAGASNAPGTAVEFDPGEHLFSFEAPGFRTIEKRLVLVERVKQRREVVIMDRAAAAQMASMASPPTGEAPARSTRPPTLAWVAFGVGGAGLTLGVVAGLVAGGRHSTLEGECNNTAGTCTPAHANDLDAFHAWRTVSTVGYVVGALGIAGGATLWLTAPKARSSTARVWLGPASAGIAGRF